jgi:hypothetical protein
MTPRPIFATACALLLLGSTTVTALAHDGFPAKPTHATAPSAAIGSAAPQLTVVGHVRTYWAINHNPERDHAVRQLTLRIRGSSFVPGSTVRLAVINTLPWKVLARGASRAQPATTSVLCSDESRTCLRPNPDAGRIDYWVQLSDAPRAANLLVLYRTAGDAGTQAVTLR